MREPGDDTEVGELEEIIAECKRKDEESRTPPAILRAAKTTGPRFKTFIPDLDEKLTPAADPSKVGFPLGRMICLNGAPYAGKSLLLCQLALKLARQGLRVVMLVEDEPREDAAERIGQGLGFMHKELNADYPTVLDNLEKKLADEKIDLSILPDEDLDGRMTIEDAGAYLYSKPAENGCVLTLDSLHAITCQEEDEGDPPRVKIEKRMKSLRALRRQGALILFSGEAARGAYASKDPNVRTSALAAGAESRAIEFGSDVVILLSEGDGGSVKVEIPKNRIGRKLGVIHLMLEAGSATLKGINQETVEANALAMREATLLPVMDKIVAAVDEKGALSAAGIMDLVAGRESKITDALRLAVKQGRLAKRGRKGKGGGDEYELPSRVN